MTVQAFIVMDTATKGSAEALNGGGVAVAPQEIVNALANNLGHGTLVGQWVAPARLLNDPDYSRWVTLLGSLPIYVMDSDTLFAWYDPNNP